MRAGGTVLGPLRVLLITGALALATAARAQAPNEAGTPVAPARQAAEPQLRAGKPQPTPAPRSAPERRPPAQPGASAAVPDASRVPPPATGTVYLRDGTQAHGTVLRSEPGNYVLLLQSNGVRTIPWQAVERVEAASTEFSREEPWKAPSPAGAAAPPACCDDALASFDPSPPTNEWPGVSLGWDARLEGISMFKRYTVAGRSSWYSGEGGGGGVSASLHFRGPPALGSSEVRWVEFEVGLGNSTHYVSWKEGPRFRTDFVVNQTSMILGAHLASGRWVGAGGAPWSGVVFGLAWLPTYVHFFDNGEFGSGGKFNPAGMRLTIDWGRVSPEKSGRLPGVRTFFTWLPYVGTLPTALSVGVGAVFY
jgi:hypothetical protein